jgi:DNA transformation protein
MAASHELVSHVLELLVPMGRPRSRRMFGGWGIYLDEWFVAIIAFERLYLKADDRTRAAFEAAGCEPFAYKGKGGDIHVMSYWSAPAEALESPGEMRQWARMALDAALRAKAAARPKAAKPTTKRAAKATVGKSSTRARPKAASAPPDNAREDVARARDARDAALDRPRSTR